MTALSAQPDDLLQPVLLVRAHTWFCALPIESVRETCRPLPTQPLEGLPPFVRGVTILRGRTTPVLHLGSMLSGAFGAAGRRYVCVQVRESPVVLEVDETIGVRRLSRSQLESTTPLFGTAGAQCIEGLAVLDGQLLAWLDTTRLVQQDLLDLVLSEGWA